MGVNSQAVHLLVDFQKIGTACRKESFYISHQTSVLAEVIFIAVNVLPACYWIGILKVILVVFLPAPASIIGAVSTVDIAHHTVNILNSVCSGSSQRIGGIQVSGSSFNEECQTVPGQVKTAAHGTCCLSIFGPAGLSAVA